MAVTMQMADFSMQAIQSVKLYRVGRVFKCVVFGSVLLSCKQNVLTTFISESSTQHTHAKSNEESDPIEIGADTPLPDPSRPLEPIETKADTVFSFAEYATTSTQLRENLGRFSSGDRSYLQFGNVDRFAVQTNARVQNTLSQVISGKKLGIQGNFWVDGYAFDKKVSGRGAGNLAELGIEASEQELNLKGYLRFLGKDRLAGNLKSAIDHVLTRDLGGDALLFGSELLGIKVGGNIGGQIGLKADLDRNIDNAAVLAFTPKSGLNAGITTKVESLSFSRVEVAGLVNLIDSSIVNQGTFGALRTISLVLGDIGMDSGVFSALDGEIVLGASVGATGELPEGLDKNLWTMMTASARDLLNRWGVWLPTLKWSHSLWNPEPVFIKDLPEFMRPFISFFKKPVTSVQCFEKYSELEKFVRDTSLNIDQISHRVNESYESSKDPVLLSRLRVLANVKTNYQLILSRVHEYCLKI